MGTQRAIVGDDFNPAHTGTAIQMLVDALQNKKNLPERTFTAVSSIPPLEDLRAAE